jgi:replication factor A1
VRLLFGGHGLTPRVCARCRQNGGQDFCEVKATIAFIRPDQITYPACQTEKCNKKMNKSPSDDRWFCEKCGNSYDAPSHRYILPMQIGDASSTMWTTAFNKEAMTILGGRTGDEMEHLKATDSDLYKSILAQAQFQTGVFRLRVKEEAYQDKAPSIRTQAMDFKPINLVNECRELIKGIHALMARN